MIYLDYVSFASEDAEWRFVMSRRMFAHIMIFSRNTKTNFDYR